MKFEDALIEIMKDYEKEKKDKKFTFETPEDVIKGIKAYFYKNPEDIDNLPEKIEYLLKQVYLEVDTENRIVSQTNQKRWEDHFRRKLKDAQIKLSGLGDKVDASSDEFKTAWEQVTAAQNSLNDLQRKSMHENI